MQGSPVGLGIVSLPAQGGERGEVEVSASQGVGEGVSLQQVHGRGRQGRRGRGSVTSGGLFLPSVGWRGELL